MKAISHLNSFRGHRGHLWINTENRGLIEYEYAVLQV